jgi:uncharacterized Zn finger protein
MNQQQQTVNLNIEQTTSITCEKCSNETFRPVVFLRKVSRFVSPDGEEHLWPLDSMECSKCGHINKEFNPTPITETKNEQKTK